MMRIYTAPGTSRDTVTLLATRETWEALLIRFPAGTYASRSRVDGVATIRNAISTAVTAAAGDTVRVTMSGENAAKVLQMAGVSS